MQRSTKKATETKQQHYITVNNIRKRLRDKYKYTASKSPDPHTMVLVFVLSETDSNKVSNVAMMRYNVLFGRDTGVTSVFWVDALWSITDSSNDNDAFRLSQHYIQILNQFSKSIYANKRNINQRQHRFKTLMRSQGMQSLIAKLLRAMRRAYLVTSLMSCTIQSTQKTYYVSEHSMFSDKKTGLLQTTENQNELSTNKWYQYNNANVDNNADDLSSVRIDMCKALKSYVLQTSNDIGNETIKFETLAF